MCIWNFFKNNYKKIWQFRENNLSLQRQFMWLTIQVSFLRGQAVYVTTHFSYSRAVMCGFLLSETIHHHLKESLAQSNVAPNGYFFAAIINKHLLNVC